MTPIITCIEWRDLRILATLRTLKVLKILNVLRADKELLPSPVSKLSSTILIITTKRSR